jgi:3-dehydroquinate dehydratase-2
MVQFDGKLSYGRTMPGIGKPRRETLSAVKLLLVQGANMEYLGRRQPELYGTTTARELDALLRRRARALGVSLDILYTNTEGEAVSAIFKADRAGINGVLFNPAGFLHAGHALRDCLRSIRAPAIEIHMTNIEKRGYGSITAEAAVGMIAGFGVDSYLLALDAIVARLAHG